MFLGAVDFVKDTLDKINGGIGQGNVDSLLREAEQWLVEIKSRDFTSTNITVHIELVKSIDGMRNRLENVFLLITIQFSNEMTWIKYERCWTGYHGER